MHHRPRCVLRRSTYCGALARPVTTPIVGFAVFMATVGASLAFQYQQLSALLVATCLNGSGVKASGKPNMTPPLRFLVVFGGDTEQVSDRRPEIRHGSENGCVNMRC